MSTCRPDSYCDCGENHDVTADPPVTARGPATRTGNNAARVNSSIHAAGDGCAVHDLDYPVYVNADTAATVPVQDLRLGEAYRDPAAERAGVWWCVDDVAVQGGTVHLPTLSHGEMDCGM